MNSNRIAILTTSLAQRSARALQRGAALALLAVLGACSGGGGPGVQVNQPAATSSVTLVVEEEPAPIQPWIHTSMVAAQADGSATQQLWPPPTFCTSVDCDGLVRFTSGSAAW